MKLKEKLCEPFGGLSNNTANELKKIAENFAIKFGEWLRINCYDAGDNWILLEDNQDYTTVEVLEIFKQIEL